MSDVGDADVGRGGPVAFFARNPVAGNLLMVLLLLGGLYTAERLEIWNVPQVDARQITVTVPYPGSSAAEVEEDINRRVEENLVPLPGVDRVTSHAREGLGSILVDLEIFANPSQVLDDVRTAVERIELFPPAAAEQPVVELAEAPRNVVTVAVKSASLSELELRRRAEAVREDLLALPSVSMVAPYGVADREISIEVSEEALRRHGITISKVAREVRQASLNLSSGELRTDLGGLVLRTQAKRTRGEDFKDVVVLSREDGTIVQLGDIALVRDDFADVELATRIDGEPCVLLTVDRNENQEPLAIAGEVKAFLANYDAPPGVDVFIWDDATRNLTGRIGMLLASGFMGFALVFVFLALVFDFRVALWVAVGVPTSFLGACLLFPAFDLSINIATIFGLIIVIGIVVDDAVVVGESIATERELGKRGPWAAVAGARSVLGPVVVGVVTTMVAFVPLLFTYGTLGQLLNIVPVVVALVLLVSLAEAFFILPSHLSHDAPWSRWPLVDVQTRVRQRLTIWRDELVVPAISAAVRRPVLTVLASVLLVVAAVLLVTTGTVRYLFFQALPADRIQADVEYPPGTPSEVTEAATQRLVAGARAANAQAGDDPVRTVAVVLGRQAGEAGLYRWTSGNEGTHFATVTLHLKDESERSLSPEELQRLWRANVGDIPGTEGLRFRIGEDGGIPGVDYALVHPNEELLG